MEERRVSADVEPAQIAAYLEGAGWRRSGEQVAGSARYECPDAESHPWHRAEVPVRAGGSDFVLGVDEVVGLLSGITDKTKGHILRAIARTPAVSA